MSKFFCAICGSKYYRLIDTYKNFWFQCLTCNNIIRERKATYLFIDLANKIVGNFPEWMKKIPKLRSIIHSISLFGAHPLYEERYGRYTEAYLMGTIEPNKTPYEFEYMKFKNRIKDIGLLFNGENLLDISGEPGFFVKSIKEEGIFTNVFCTAYNPSVAEGMTSRLNIPTVAYDFQKDLLREKLPNNIRFDFVSIRYAINFCINLNKFSKDLHTIMREDGVVFVSFVVPSLGTCLRWLFDDYVYNYLYNPETMIKAFAQNGFKLLYCGTDEDPYYYLNTVKPFYMKPFYKYYEFLNRKAIGADPLMQNHCIVVFKKLS